MGDYIADYNPAHTLEQEEMQVEQPIGGIGGIGVAGAPPAVAGGIGVAGAPPAVVGLLTKRDRFKDLADKEQHARLHQALMDHLAHKD
jgi:hypothetical protein